MAKARVKGRARTKKASRGPLSDLRGSLQRLRADGAQIVRHIQRDASRLLKDTRSEAAKDVRAVRSDLERRANQTVREIERRLLKQIHAATEAQVRRLEQRIARLEQQVNGALRRRRAA